MHSESIVCHSEIHWEVTASTTVCKMGINDGPKTPYPLLEESLINCAKFSAVLISVISETIPGKMTAAFQSADVPTKLEDVINKALEKDRDLRYQHASEIRTDLKRLQRDTDSGRITSSGSVIFLRDYLLLLQAESQSQPAREARKTDDYGQAETAEGGATNKAFHEPFQTGSWASYGLLAARCPLKHLFALKSSRGAPATSRRCFDSVTRFCSSDERFPVVS